MLQGLKGVLYLSEYVPDNYDKYVDYIKEEERIKRKYYKLRIKEEIEPENSPEGEDGE